MWIDLLYDFIPRGQYLVFATVCKKWRGFLLKLNYSRTTRFSALENQHLVDWARIPTNNSRICEAAALGGNLELITFLWICKYTFTSTVFENAIRSGNLELIKYLLLRKCPKQRNFELHAIGANRYDIYNYLITKNFTDSRDLYAYAISRYSCVGDTIDLFWHVINGRDMGFIQYFVNHHREFYSIALVKKVIESEFEIIMRNYIQYGNGFMEYATTKTIKWALDIGYRPDYVDWSIMFRRGLVEAMEYAIFHHNIIYFEDSLDSAIFNGHLGVIKWALEHGCTIDRSVITESVIIACEQRLQEVIEEDKVFYRRLEGNCSAVGKCIMQQNINVDVPLYYWEAVGDYLALLEYLEVLN